MNWLLPFRANWNNILFGKILHIELSTQFYLGCRNFGRIGPPANMAELCMVTSQNTKSVEYNFGDVFICVKSANKR